MYLPITANALAATSVRMFALLAILRWGCNLSDDNRVIKRPEFYDSGLFIGGLDTLLLEFQNTISFQISILSQELH
jgi:hypothetical protein